MRQKLLGLLVVSAFVFAGAVPAAMAVDQPAFPPATSQKAKPKYHKKIAKNPAKNTMSTGNTAPKY